MFKCSILIMFFLFIPVEESVSCENPGLPDNGYQILSKRLYLPGESLNFMCYQGYELIGEITIKCILGNPSFWSGPIPMCRGKACHIYKMIYNDIYIWICNYMQIYVNVLLILFFSFANVANHECSGNHALEGRSCYCVLPTYSLLVSHQDKYSF